MVKYYHNKNGIAIAFCEKILDPDHFYLLHNSGAKKNARAVQVAQNPDNR